MDKFTIVAAFGALLVVAATYLFASNQEAEAEHRPASLAPPQVEEISDCLEQIRHIPPQFLDDSKSSRRVIVVYKRQERIGLYEDGVLVEADGIRGCFPVSLGIWPYEPKVRRDYASTPEGWYAVVSKHTSDPNDAYPHTSFYKGLFVDYPNIKDVERALSLEVINQTTADGLVRQIVKGELPSQETPMGGAILIHGWNTAEAGATAGCVGVDDKNIDWLFERVDVATPILILPWRLKLYEDGLFAMDTAPPPPRIADFTSEGIKNMVDEAASAESGRIVFEALTIRASP